MPKPRDGSADYEVGYGKPPKSGQFRKGRSGNPKGRPKGTLNQKTYFEQALSAKVSVKMNGRKVTMTKLEAAIHTHVNKAVTGDLRALIHVLDKLQGLGIGLGVPDAGTGHLPVTGFYSDVIERALAARMPDTGEVAGEDHDGREGEA